MHSNSGNVTFHTGFHPVGGRLIQQSVLKGVRKRPEGVVEGAAIGNDAAIFRNGDIFISQAVGAAATGWFPEDAVLSAGDMAWITARNQLSTVGAKATSAQILLTVGSGCPEDVIRREMRNLNRIAAEEKIPVVGGNTVYFGDSEDCLIQVMMTGEWQEKPVSKPKAGDVIYFLGEAGTLGAELLAVAKRDFLSEYFSDSYIDSMRYPKGAFSCESKADAALSAGAIFLHDISYGGVYTALYQLAEACGTGIAVTHEGITIRQSVIELSEKLGINPYLLLGTGGLLAVVPADLTESWENRMAEIMSEINYEREPDRPAEYSVRKAAVLTEEKARVVRAEGFPMERYLNLPEGDAMEECIRSF